MPLGNPIRKQNESRMVSVLATEGQTVFTVQGGYIINHISVFRNGVRLSPAEDFTAGDGSTVTLNDAANVEDRIDFHVFDRFTVQNAIIGAASTQTINGDLVLNGKLFGALDVPSINLTGIITATELDLNGKGDISGDLNVVGVTTLAKAIIGTGVTIDQSNIDTVGIITATTFKGALTGAATRVTVTDQSADTSCNVLFTQAATGDLTPHSGTNLTFNSSSGALTATTFVGNLTGNVTGTASGNPTLANGADNRVITATGANALTGESSLTYDGTKILNITSSAGGFFQGTDSDGGIGLIEMGNGNVAIQADTGNSIGSSKIQFFVDNSEKAQIDSSGRLLLGTTTASTVGNSSYSRLEVCANSSTSTGPAHLTLKSGTVTTSLSSGDTLARLIFSSLDGGDYAYIQASADASPGSADFPGRMMFFTTANGASSATERLRIKHNGHIAIGDDITNDTGMFKVIAGDGDSADLYVGQFENREETAGQSYGVNIRAGSNSTDHGLRVMNRANDTTQFLVRGDGKVGINENSPDQLLHIKDSNPFLELEGTAGSSGDTGIFLNANGNHWLVRADNNGSANTFSIKSGDTSSSTHRLLISNAGDVGINETGPSGKLDVASGSDTKRGLRVTGGASGGTEIAQFRTNNGTARFTVNNDVTVNTGNLVIGTNGKGIDFSANTSDSAGVAAEVLDDYEEGTFTPNIQGTGSNHGKTYAIQQGKYTRIGNIVHCEFRVSWTSIPTGDTGSGIVNGFPFTMDNNPGTGAAIGAMACNQLNFVDGNQVTAAFEAANGQQYVYFLVTYDAGGWNNPTASSLFPNNGEVRGAVTYRVA